MKKIFLLFLILGNLSLHADDIIKVQCDHVSIDNWPLGGETPIFSLEIDEEGFFLAASIDSNELLVSESGTTLIEMANNDSSVCGTGGCIRIYGNTFYEFNNESLAVLKPGEELRVNMISNDYMASFNASLDCVRIN